MGEHAPLRVLQVLNHMDYGGIESVVMNYYRFIDRRKVQFDFAVSKDSGLPQRDEITRLGGSIYHFASEEIYCCVNRHSPKELVSNRTLPYEYVKRTSASGGLSGRYKSPNLPQPYHGTF